MNAILSAATGAASPLQAQNPLAAWDLLNFLKNTKDYGNLAGGALLSLLGLAVIIWAGVLIAKKFFGGQSAQQESWFKIAAMLIVGGAMFSGGIGLLVKVSSGGEKTITDLGGGFVLIQHSLLPLLGIG